MASYSSSSSTRANSSSSTPTNTSRSRTPISWTETEELALVNSILTISDIRIATKDRKKDFWKRVRKDFHLNQGLEDDPRNEDMLTGKWTALKKDLLEYNRYYEMDAEVIQDHELQISQAEGNWKYYHKCKFPHFSAWSIAKAHTGVNIFDVDG